jgi:hypothetical protein
LKNTKNQTEPILSSLVRILDSSKTNPNRSNYTPCEGDVLDHIQEDNEELIIQ